MKRARRSIIGAWSVVALAWLSFSAPGCKRPDSRDACVVGCECVTGAACDANSPGVDTCVTFAEAEREAALERGCGAEFDDKTACYATEADCPTTNATCKTEVDAYDACVKKTP